MRTYQKYVARGPRAFRFRVEKEKRSIAGSSSILFSETIVGGQWFSLRQQLEQDGTRTEGI